VWAEGSQRPYLESAITIHNVINFSPKLVGVLVSGVCLLKSLLRGFYSCWLHFEILYSKIFHYVVMVALPVDTYWSLVESDKVWWITVSSGLRQTESGWSPLES
jgi:hypothetical protein